MSGVFAAFWSMFAAFWGVFLTPIPDPTHISPNHTFKKKEKGEVTRKSMGEEEDSFLKSPKRFQYSDYVFSILKSFPV